MKSSLMAESLSPRVSSFDPLVEEFAGKFTSFTESDALKATHWEMGEDARLREDARFRKTKWGRWILSSALVANGSLYEKLVREFRPELKLSDELKELSGVIGHKCVFCPADDRFVLQGEQLRLSAKQLTDRPLIEGEILDIEKFTTHLPVHSLKAAAASEPAGEWGPNTQEQHIETLGWVRVSAPGRRKFNERMFVAQVEGNSMDDGRSGLVNGGYAIFELWPEGTRQNLSVLVRASFSDPETGSYAVKKYVGDVRDEEGRHHEIRLVSLNPDKTRYPDIIVSEDADVTVVAKLVQSLTLDDYAREPKRPKRPGHRNLGDPEQVEELHDKLKRLSERFFSPAESIEEELDRNKEDWKARLVCLDIESGALCIETRPISGLPSFAKKLFVAAEDDQRIVLGANLKFRACRTPVKPCTERYSWSTSPPDEMVNEQLTEYTIEGLPDDNCTLFKVDASDTGMLISGNQISYGNTYRIILPPSVQLADCGLGTVSDLGEGWKLWDLTIPFPASPELQNALASLGYKIGQIEPLAKWIVTSPIGYRESAKGESYPVFATTQKPILQVSGVTASIHGELMVLMVGSSDPQSLALQPGSEWCVAFADLSPGRYMAQIIHERTKVSAVRIPFEVAASDLLFSDVADLKVQLSGELIQADAIGDFHLELDLVKHNGAIRDSLSIVAPPCWTLRVQCDDGRRRKGVDLIANSDGSICLDGLWESVQDQLQRSCIAAYSLDAAELGTIIVRHSHRTTLDHLREGFSSLLLARQNSFSELDGRFPLLRNLWLHPIFETLGYRWDEISDIDPTKFPEATGACLLTVPTVDDAGRIRKHLSSAVVMTSSQILWDSTDDHSIRHFANLLCKHYKLNDAFLTDGVRWAKHRHNSKLKLKVLDFPNVVRSENISDFEDFVREFANLAAVED